MNVTFVSSLVKEVIEVYYLRLLLGPFLFVVSISFSIFSQMIVSICTHLSISNTCLKLLELYAFIYLSSVGLHIGIRKRYVQLYSAADILLFG